MGGKTKQAQRTKNNSRPSSSGRSAELLGSSVPSFFGFTSLDNNIVPVVPGFVSIESNSDEIDPNLDDTYQIVLRKMSKKDPTTKTKALQEFSELVNKSDVEIVKAVLPFWPRLYSNLSTDVEHRVRETAQQAQAAVVAKAGKNIAPFLRQLAPAWICSQYDTYAPASSIASQTFSNAFPQNKLREVFVYCENEIIDYFTKNLTVHTAITLSNPKSHTPEECENKYQRVLVSSLRGYALYLEKMPEENLKKASNKNAVLLDSQKFWTYHKHKTPNIRAAWFEVISALLQFAPFLIEKYEQQLTTSVFQFIDETEPIVIPHIWASVILIQSKVTNWHTYLNFDKAVFPKLWKVLKSGATGNAAGVFPQMLPLVSKITREILDDKILKFYTLFFENTNLGLKVAHSSRSDISAISHAYYEVLQYVVIQLLKDEHIQQDELKDFCNKLLEDHLVSVIKWCINTETSSGKYIFNNISTLLDYWCQHSPTQPIYASLLQTFWTRLYEVIESSVETVENAEKVTNSHIELVQNLKRTSFKKVKFSAETDQTDSCMKSQEHALKFEAQLQDLVYKLCKLYMEKVPETRDQTYVMHLEYLLRAFQCPELLKYLCDSEADNISTLYNKFSVWLHDDKLRCEYIVEIILILYKYLSAEERIQMLNEWIKTPIKTVQSWIILRALSHPLCQEPDITKLLMQPEVTENLLQCARSVTDGDLKENLILIHKCFFISESGDILIDTSTCAKIIDTICIPLTDDTKITARDTCASFLAQIMPVICGDAKQKELQNRMFLNLFEFSAENNIHDFLSEDTLWEVTTAWQDALSSEDLVLDDVLVSECSNIVNEQLKKSVVAENWSLESFDKLTEITAKLVVCSTESIKNDEADKMTKVDKLLNSILNKNQNLYMETMRKLENLSLYIEFLNGYLTSKNVQDDSAAVVEKNFEELLQNLLINSLFRLSVIFKLSCNIKKKDKLEDAVDRMEDDDEEEYTEDFCDGDENLIKSWSELIHEHVINVIYAASIGDTLLYSTTSLNKTSELLVLVLQEKLALMINNLDSEIVGKIKEKLFSASNTEGLLWAKSLTILLNLEQYSDKENGAVLLYEDVATTLSFNDNMMGYVNILQKLSRKMAPNCLPILPNLFENYFDLLVKISSTRCLILNHFSSNFNEIVDRKIIGNSLIILNDVITRNKKEPFLLYNCDLSQGDRSRVFLDAEVANLLSDILKYYPTELDLSRWDFIRIALSSWTLTVSKSQYDFSNQSVSIFICAIYRLFTSLTNFIKEEKTKSSTELITNVIEEWDNLFAKEVNLVLLKTFINVVSKVGGSKKSEEYFLDAISAHVDSIDFTYVLKTNKIDSKITMDDLIKFALDNISHRNHNIRIACATILKRLSLGLIKIDLELLMKRNDQSDTHEKDGEIDDTWHLLHKFHDRLEYYSEPVNEFIEDFNFKATESDSSNVKLDIEKSLSYLLLWDCIISICAKSPPELRSIYAAWITRHQYEQILLPTLFKLMPPEILKNVDSGLVYGQTMFSPLDWTHIKSTSITPERFACHLYAQTLRHLPAVVRKWWHGSNHRHAAIIDKITTNCISNILCQEELQYLIEKKERQENMQMKVHVPARQVTAVYSIDEAKMELHITLPTNHPLGPVKVESGKQIGSRLQSRQVVMQLTIFLTHQNGSIWDGLSLWKKNLDRKFEGVEECYVCYSVLHQDTCQLPKLTCKTCKKKFHGPCLYRWFSTSNKSTCPICRNSF